MALNEEIIPPTVGLMEPDPECDLDYTPNTARNFAADIALSNSLGFGGHNGCIALRKMNL
jgi:3-oxoacyl-[acyl-carrier-protein] synthase II